MSICFRRMVYVGLACVAVSPALAQNVSPTIAELASYAGADRTARLIAGAKKEGVVSVYSSVTVDDQKALSAETDLHVAQGRGHRGARREQ